MKLGDADPVPRIMAHLAGHAGLTAVLGAPSRVGADHTPPYPRLRVRPEPGGSDDPDTLIVVQPVRLEVLDSLEEPSGDERLRRILYTAVEAVLDLRLQQPLPGHPVIHHVGIQTKAQPLPEPDGRGRWFCVLSVHARPTP